MTIVLPTIRWTPSPNYSSRGGARTHCIVVHDCEGSYAGSIAWFAMPESRVSAHLVLREDGREATQMVAWGNKAWHACDFNAFSEGIEAAGYAAKGFPDSEMAALAAIVAWRLQANGIPLQEATVGNGWTGFTEHAKLGAAGGGHHDFTEDPYVWSSFVSRVLSMCGGAPSPVTPRAAANVPDMPSGFAPSATQRCDEPVGSIAWAQSRLNQLGYGHPTLIVDGLEGMLTERALARFQAAHGLYQDGILGPDTIRKLSE
jgi:hypothetical protein